MATTIPAIDGSCAVQPPGAVPGSCQLTDWGPNGLPAHWVADNPEVPQSPDPAKAPPDDCPTCGKAKEQVKTKTSYGPIYTTATTNVDGSGTSYGVGVQSNWSTSTSTSMCTQFGESPGVTSTVSGSWMGASVNNSQSFGAPFSDAANSTQVCVPTQPSTSTGVSVGIGGIK